MNVIVLKSLVSFLQTTAGMNVKLPAPGLYGYPRRIETFFNFNAIFNKKKNTKKNPHLISTSNREKWGPRQIKRFFNFIFFFLSLDIKVQNIYVAKNIINMLKNIHYQPWELAPLRIPVGWKIWTVQVNKKLRFF